MTITNYELANLAFVPGNAESLELKARVAGKGWLSLDAKDLKNSRKNFYTDLVLTVISLAGAIFTGMVAWKAVAAVGLVVTALAAKNLYDTAQKIKGQWDDQWDEVQEDCPIFIHSFF